MNGKESTMHPEKSKRIKLNGSGTCNMDVTKRKCQNFPLKGRYAIGFSLSLNLELWIFYSF